jgi:hypothetical protein
VGAIVALVVIIGAVAAVALVGGDDDDDGSATRTTQIDETDDTESTDDTDDDATTDDSDTTADTESTDDTDDDTATDDTATDDETRGTTVFPEDQFDSYVDSCVSSATDAAAIGEEDARNYCQCTWDELQARGVELTELFELGTTGDLTEAPQAVQDAITACVPELLGS